MHATTACGVELLSQHSFAKCTLGKSFGCVNATHAFVRSCRGVFRCASGAADGFACGYPPGRASYACACDGRADDLPDDPGAPPCKRSKSAFNVEDKQVSRLSIEACNSLSVDRRVLLLVFRLKRVTSCPSIEGYYFLSFD